MSSQQQSNIIKEKYFKSKDGLDYKVCIKQQGNPVTEWWNLIRPADHFIVLNEVFDTMIENEGYKFDRELALPNVNPVAVTTSDKPVVVEKEEKE